MQPQAKWVYVIISGVTVETILREILIMYQVHISTCNGRERNHFCYTEITQV